jgi:hypothetical protein
MSNRCAIWARVSRDEQESGNQLSQLHAEAARHGLARRLGSFLLRALATAPPASPTSAHHTKPGRAPGWRLDRGRPAPR